MTTLDQFESVFKAADKAVYHYAPVRIGSVLLVTDLAADDAAALERQARDFLSAIDGPETEWSHLRGDDFDSVGKLLDLVAERSPDLIVAYRHLHSDAWNWPHSLGEYVDVLTQATDYPVLVLPHPDASHALPHSVTNTDRVMAMTDHLTGDERLVNCAVSFTAAGGICWLTHIESSQTFDRYMDMISKIAAIDTETAREEIQEQLLREPRDYIGSCRAVLEKTEGLDVRVEALVTIGRRLGEYRRLIEEHEVDLLVLYTRDEDQLAMHGLAYPLAVELRQIPLLMM